MIRGILLLSIIFLLLRLSFMKPDIEKEQRWYSIKGEDSGRMFDDVTIRKIGEYFVKGKSLYVYVDDDIGAVEVARYNTDEKK